MTPSAHDPLKVPLIKWDFCFLLGGGRTGNRRFWAASWPNPAPGPGKGLGRGPSPSMCTDFQPGGPILNPFREVVWIPLVLALETVPLI